MVLGHCIGNGFRELSAHKHCHQQDLDVEVAKLRAYLRLSHELGFLPMKKYEVWSGMAVEIGKMLGGWLKTIKSQPKT